ncbi:MAG: hypothetical protein H6712_31565 [Myxococcales bacterium]|nr:hypothetical protein [Myxococcales bacterium]
MSTTRQRRRGLATCVGVLGSIAGLGLVIACVRPGPNADLVVPAPTDEGDADPSETDGAPSPPEHDRCEGHDALVIDPPAPIAAQWQGAATVGGTGPLVLRWCGEGIVIVRSVTVVRPHPDGTDAVTVLLELEAQRGALGHGDELTMTIHTPAQPGTLGVIAVAEDGDGRSFQARTTLEVIEDPERTAQREACLASGGRWGPQGMLGVETCDRPTRDAGKRCLSDADCEGACLEDTDEPFTGNVPVSAPLPRCGPGQELRVRVGRCHDRTTLFGCHSRLRATTVECVAPGAARRKNVICVD